MRAYFFGHVNTCPVKLYSSYVLPIEGRSINLVSRKYCLFHFYQKSCLYIFKERFLRPPSARKIPPPCKANVCDVDLQDEKALSVARPPFTFRYLNLLHTLNKEQSFLKNGNGAQNENGRFFLESNPIVYNSKKKK